MTFVRRPDRRSFCFLFSFDFRCFSFSSEQRESRGALARVTEHGRVSAPIRFLSESTGQEERKTHREYRMRRAPVRADDIPNEFRPLFRWPSKSLGDRFHRLALFRPSVLSLSAPLVVKLFQQRRFIERS